MDDKLKKSDTKIIVRSCDTDRGRSKSMKKSSGLKK